MRIFQRLFQIGQAEYNVINKLEDPIRMTEQGIRDLKSDLQGAITGLAGGQGVAIRLTKRPKRPSVRQVHTSASDVDAATLPGWPHGHGTSGTSGHRSVDDEREAPVNVPRGCSRMLSSSGGWPPSFRKRSRNSNRRFPDTKMSSLPCGLAPDTAGD